MGTLIHALTTIALLLVGPAFVVCGVLAWRKSAASPTWLPVTAKILRSKVRSDSEGAWYPEVWYRYSVDGLELESSQLRILTVTAGKKRAQAIVDRYPPTKEVIAYVNPAKHAESVLEPGEQQSLALVMILAGLSTLAYGVYRVLLTFGVV